MVDLIKYLNDDLGIFVVGIIAVLVSYICILEYIKRINHNPFMSTYNDSSIVKSKIYNIISMTVTMSSIWFLFSIVYIFFI